MAVEIFMHRLTLKRKGGMDLNRNRFFFPIFFILLGLTLLVKVIFRLEYNMFSVGFAILLLLSGFSLLTNGFGTRKTTAEQGGENFFFFSGTVNAQPKDERVQLFFSSAVVELSNPPREGMEVLCAFGDVRIRVPEGHSVRAQCSCAFGNIETPRGGIPGFGERSVLVGDGLQANITVHCVFGQITLVD